MRGIYSLADGVPEVETVAQVVVVLDGDIASWLAGWITAHADLVQYSVEPYPRELAEALAYALRYENAG